MLVDPVQAAFDVRLRTAGPERRMRLHAELYQDALRLAWAQVDRAAPMSELATARFLLRRLYPDLEGERLESIMTRLTAEFEAGTWTGFARPERGG